MRLTGLLFATAAALSMIAAPALAQPANPAAKLSLANGAGSNVRAGAPTKRSSKFLSGTPLILLGIAVTATVVGVAVSTSHSDNKPASA
jgi:hypothetical protein